MLHTSRVCFDQILANGPHTNTIHPLQSISLCRPVGRHAPQVSPLELPKLFPSFGDKLGSATKLWQPPFCGSGCWEHVALWQDLHVQGLGFGAHLRLSGLCCGIWKCRRFKSLAVESTLEPWSRLKRPPQKKKKKKHKAVWVLPPRSRPAAGSVEREVACFTAMFGTPRTLCLTWRFMGSYMWGYKSPNTGYKHSYPT